MKAEAEYKSISGLTVAFVVVGLLACALVFALIFLFTGQPTTEQQTAAIHAHDSAFNMEQTTPNADARALAATQEAALQGYGWVDQQTGIARIPIARAMELMVTNQPTAAATSP